MSKTTRIGNSFVKIDIDKIENLKEMLKAKIVAQVGVLGSKAASRKALGSLIKEGGHKKTRGAADMTNASIGLVHEKGSLSQNIPARSFLKLPFLIKSKGLFAIKAKLWAIYLQGEHTPTRLKQAYRDLGIAAENIIHAAFSSGGFGRWQKLSPKTIARKKSSAILIDSRQLERSVDSRVGKR
jgi:hypothetical protein